MEKEKLLGIKELYDLSIESMRSIT